MIADVISGGKRWHIEQGEALAVLRSLPDACVDAVVTDPPAGISFMGKDWDGAKGGRAAWVAWLAAILAECYRVAKPGARILCWSIPRTSHWTGCAIEDAGWLIENVVTHLFGSGFPKGKSQLKPAAEFWYLARKPGGKVQPLQIDRCRVATREDLNGGAYSDGGRAATLPGDTREGASLGMLRPGARPSSDYEQPAGRWPANLLLSHSDGCRRVGEKRVKGSNVPGTGASPDARQWCEGSGLKSRPAHSFTAPDGLETVEAWECADGCAVAELDRQSGHLHGPGLVNPSPRKGMGFSGGDGTVKPPHDFGDSGGASRFFTTFPGGDAPPFLYAAKASRRERNRGCEGLPERASTFANATRRRCEEHDAPIPTGSNAYSCGCPIRYDSPREITEGRNGHPTVKPQALMRWLCRIITPPGGLVIDPFAGSGSTGVAALAEGLRFVGIEREAAYVEIARNRCTNVLAGNAPAPVVSAQLGMGLP